MNTTQRFLALVIAASALAGCDAFVSPEARIEKARAALESGDHGTATVHLRKVVQKDSGNVEARTMLAELSMHLGDVASVRQDIVRAYPTGRVEGRAAELLAEASLQLNEASDVLKRIDAGTLVLTEPARSVFRARALAHINRMDDARAQLESTVSAHPQSAEALTWLAQIRLVNGETDDALALMDRAIAASPTYPEAWILKSRALLHRGQFALAEEVASRANKELPGKATTIPHRVQLISLLVEAQLGLGRLDDAGKTRADLEKMIPESPISRMLNARIALAKGDYPTGIAELQRVVTVAPGMVQARMLLGAAQLAQGSLLQAEQQLTKVIESAPDNVEARKLLARVRMQLDQPDAAMSVLSPALETGTTDTQLYGLLGLARFRAGQTDEALEAFEQAAKARPDDENAQLDLATAYLTANRPQQATALLRKIKGKPGNVRREALLVAAVAAEQGPILARAEIERMMQAEPDRAELAYVAVNFYMSQREFDRARVLLDRLAAATPNAPMPLMAKATLELTAGDVSAAEKAVRQAASLEAKDPGIQLALAQVLFTRNDLAGGRSAIEAAMKSAPARGDLANAAGQLLMDAQRFDEALVHFRRAAELDTRNAGYWLNVSRAQVALDQPQAAKESIDAALKARPNWVEAESMRVMLDLRSGGHSAALARARDLRRKNPSSQTAAVLEGDVQMAGKQYKDAAKVYAEAERLRPAAALAVKLHTALRLGAQPKAAEPLERWLERRPNDSNVRLVLAQYYMGGGQYREATGEYEQIVRESAANPAVLNNLAWLYDVSGREEAEATARRAHELAPTNPAIADTYGWILLRKKKVTQALPLLESAARAIPKDPTIQYHYSAALAQAGRQDEARELLARIVDEKHEFADRPAAERLLQDLRS